MATLVWFRDDLRLADHPALHAAANDPDGMVLLYLLDEETPGARPLGGAAKWWLHHSLTELQETLDARGIPLILRRGAASEVIPAVVAESRIDTVYWNRRYSAERDTDAQLKKGLREAGVEVRSFPGSLLYEPWTITTQTGGNYRVYSAFWRACLAAPAPESPLPVPDSWVSASYQPASDALAEWRLLPTSPNWASEFSDRWHPGEAGAVEQFESFLADRVGDYKVGRDVPSTESTSMLSPHLRWGEISPRQIWHHSLDAGVEAGEFLSEIGWREFAWHTLFHNPDLHTRGLDRRFDSFPWRRPDADELEAWQFGRTGFPFVDAGMQELWRTGYMHNRVRMVVASFLTKNLLLDWRIGEEWFWDTLVDADAANNPFNWQWVAGCGADAAPYFRIFNPQTQLKKFDPEGKYVDRWAPESLLNQEIVDLKESRLRALHAYDAVKNDSVA